MDFAVVGDDGHAGVEGVAPAVERLDGFAGGGAAGDEAAGEFGGVVDMKRAALVEADIVGDVDQRRDRPHADGAQTALHPVGRRAIGDAAHHTAKERRAGFGIVGADSDRVGEVAMHGGDGARFERADAERGEIAGDTMDAHAVLPVRGNGDVEDRIGEAGIVNVAGANRSVAGQLNDAVVFVGQFEFTHRAHHAARFDAADGGDLEGDVAAGDKGAGCAEDALHSGACVRSAADDLLGFAGAGEDREDLQLVGLRVRRGSEDLGDGEGSEPCRRVVDRFDFKTERGQCGSEFIDRGGGFEMVFQPREGELHAPTPTESVGTSKAEKP